MNNMRGVLVIYNNEDDYIVDSLANESKLLDEYFIQGDRRVEDYCRLLAMVDSDKFDSISDAVNATKKKFKLEKE